MNYDINDLILLEEVNIENICRILQTRFKKSIIYTSIGQVLISVNPFKQITNLYSLDNIDEYKTHYFWEKTPHIFSFTEDTMRSMKFTGDHQCVIISGESGAGKTEASKLLLKYVTVSSKNEEKITAIKEQLLASNPVLESFGNAMTLRNDNSSRFGKYFEIFFNYENNPIGGAIYNYLLEKIRIISPSKGERNYHIFYQVLNGITDPKKKETLHVKPPEFFNLLNQSQVFKINGVDDNKNFSQTVKSMKTVGFTMEEIDDIVKILLSILWIGQVQFTSDTNADDSKIVDHEPIKIAAELLQVKEENLKNSFIKRTFQAGSTITLTHLNAVNAEKTKNSFCNNLYSKLFDWLIEKINEKLNPREFDRRLSSDKYKILGILDIYGFEIFEHNSFEQFFINYANEKLQQIFIEQTIKTEQEEYVNEGIEWISIDYFNNRIVCDLIDKTPHGILAYLDEECVLPKGTDEKFHSKILHIFGNHPHISTLKKASTVFTIKHYAGDVIYDANGFVEKNRDLIWKDLIILGESSKINVMKHIYKGLSEDFSKKRPLTLGTQFKNSIKLLLESLKKCNPHYIRCIKPNDKKQAAIFNEERVSHQIKYLGLNENVKVKQAGFAFRTTYEIFIHRYKMICSSLWPRFNCTEKEAVEKIFSEVELKHKEDYEFGKTKVFIKRPTSLFMIEEKREIKLEQIVIKLQALVRGYLGRKFVIEYMAAILIQNKYRNFVKGREYREGKDNLKDFYADKKIRRRLSAKLYPIGDYLIFSSNNKWKLLSQKKKDQSKILFSDFIFKFDRKYKKEEQIVVLSQKCLYFLRFKLLPNNAKSKESFKKLKICRVNSLNDVKSITLSKYADNYMAIEGSKFNTLYNLTRKTEFIMILSKKYMENNRNPINIVYQNEMKLKIKSKKILTFKFSGDGEPELIK